MQDNWENYKMLLTRLFALITLTLFISGCAVNSAIDNWATSGTDYTVIPKQRLCFIVVEKSPIYYEYSTATKELARRGENCDDYESKTIIISD